MQPHGLPPPQAPLTCLSAPSLTPLHSPSCPICHLISFAVSVPRCPISIRRLAPFAGCPTPICFPSRSSVCNLTPSACRPVSFLIALPVHLSPRSILFQFSLFFAPTDFLFPIFLRHSVSLFSTSRGFSPVPLLLSSQPSDLSLSCGHGLRISLYFLSGHLIFNYATVQFAIISIFSLAKRKYLLTFYARLLMIEMERNFKGVLP